MSLPRQCRIASVLLIGLAAPGCVSTTMGSAVSPQGVTAYHKVLVGFPQRDLGIRTEVERRFQETYDYFGGFRRRAADTLFVPAHALFFPGATYTSAQLDSIIAVRHVDGVLIVSLGESGEKNWHSAGVFAQCTQWTYGQCSNAMATSYDNDYAIPWTTYEARLYDVKTGDVVWVGSGESRGQATTSTRADLARSIADKAVQQLIKDGVVPKP